MSGLQMFWFALIFCELEAVPVVIKESSPNGESVISISSSNPEVEKYILDYAAKHAKQDKASPFTGRSQNHGTVVQSFSIATPEKAIAGTGRSFGDDSLSNPFFVPHFVRPNLEGFDVGNWLRNLERFYDPSFAGGGTSVSATAVNDNGNVYGKVETRKLDSKGHK